MEQQQLSLGSALTQSSHRHQKLWTEWSLGYATPVALIMTTRWHCDGWTTITQLKIIVCMNNYWEKWNATWRKKSDLTFDLHRHCRWGQVLRTRCCPPHPMTKWLSFNFTDPALGKFFKIIAQHGARTPDPEVKTLVLYPLSKYHLYIIIKLFFV